MKRNNFISIALAMLALLLAPGCQTKSAMQSIALAGFQPAPFDEQTISFKMDPEVKVHINAPQKFPANKKVKLIFFTLPNANTTSQTIGKLPKPGDDWHFDIQHIGAQTRFLRQLYPDTAIVIVYLEANQRSWPTWRKKHADQPQLIPQMIDSIRSRFQGFNVRVTLSAHSGGGSAIFGYLNATNRIPNAILNASPFSTATMPTTKLSATRKNSWNGCMPQVNIISVYWPTTMLSRCSTAPISFPPPAARGGAVTPC